MCCVDSQVILDKKREKFFTVGIDAQTDLLRACGCVVCVRLFFVCVMMFFVCVRLFFRVRERKGAS